jgi:hypothetical protein
MNNLDDEDYFDDLPEDKDFGVDPPGEPPRDILNAIRVSTTKRREITVTYDDSYEVLLNKLRYWSEYGVDCQLHLNDEFPGVKFWAVNEVGEAVWKLFVYLVPHKYDNSPKARSFWKNWENSW